MGGAAIAPPMSLVEKDKELPRDFPYEEDSRAPASGLSRGAQNGRARAPGAERGVSPREAGGDPPRPRLHRGARKAQDEKS